MSYSNVGSIPRIGTYVSHIEIDTQNWKTLTTYQAKSTTQEKVCRVANNLVFGAALCGAYAYFTGSAGLVSFTAMALAARKIASTIIGYIAYPAAFTSFSRSSRDYYQEVSKNQIQSLKNEGFFVKKISIYKSGVKYDATITGHSSTIDNGKWTIQALGNGMMMEPFIQILTKENLKYHSNTLLMNGPSVCESGGWPTRYQMGAGFEAGIQLLEYEIKATHIAMRGLSLGGGMMAEAILNHDFLEDVCYLSISDRTFGRLSTIAGSFVGSIVKPIFYATNTELDGIAAARTLSQLGIRHIIIQHISHNAEGRDPVIPDNVSLMHELNQEGLHHKCFLGSTKVSHNGPLPQDLQDSLDHELNQFFRSNLVT